MKKTNEKGVALILTMILLLLISIMGVSLMFVSQTETWSSLNYRLMSQARDGAEAGINSAANYLMFTYVPPNTAGTDLLTSYNMTASPVQYPLANASGHDVTLSASSVSSNYPVTAVQSAFDTNGIARGNFTAGNATVNYATSAKLVTMQHLGTSLYLATPTTIQTWEITSTGTIGGVRSATEQITAILERQPVAVFGYAAFATSGGCSALSFGGGGTTDSYNSGDALVGGVPATTATNGNVGTNGNLSTVGNPTTINGNLSTPRAGTGTCTTSNVTAWTEGTGHVTGSLVELPQTVVFPTPSVPPAGSVNLNTNSSCPFMAGTGATCTKTTVMTIAPTVPNGTVNLGDLSLTGNKDLHLAAGTYNINTLREAGNTALVLDSVPVILQVTGTGGGTVIDLTGGGLVNTTNNFDPSTFQMIYAGDGAVALKGGAAAVGLLYAPNASFSFGGNGDWYGSVIGNTMTDMGGAAIHYDRKLKDKYYVPGPFMLNSFTWNKY